MTAAVRPANQMCYASILYIDEWARQTENALLTLSFSVFTGLKQIKSDSPCASFNFGSANLICVYIWPQPRRRLFPRFLQSPLRRAQESNRLRGLSVTYSGFTPSPPLAFVTLMHWFDNICGMVIPRFPPRCRITSYSLSCRVSQLVHSEVCRGSVISLQNNSGEWMN